MNGLRQDLRLALRVMRQQPGLALAALLSLALGLGANTALFSIAYGVLMRPLPYPEAERLVRISEVHPGATMPIRGSFLSDHTLRAWAEDMDTLEGIAAYSRTSFLDRSSSHATRLAGAEVSPELFPILRVRPLAGRLLVPEDAHEGAPPVAVISEGLFRERFGGDPTAVGSTLRLDGTPHAIVGVVEPGFHFPDRDVRLWMPYRMPPAQAESRAQSIRLFTAIGRLRPGAGVLQAAAEGTAAARSIERPVIADAIFGEGGPVEVRVQTLLDQMTAGVQPALTVLGVGVACVLLICCANVANLLLSRGINRQRELAVRVSLGAGRRRIAQQVVVESLVLSGLGGILGLGLAWSLVGVLPDLAPESFPRLEDVALDGRTLAFAVVTTLAAGLVAGLLPALRTARRDLFPALREGSGTSAGPRGSRLGSGLLVVEAALAVMLLVAAGLLVRSFASLISVDPGYDPDRVLLAQLFFEPGTDEVATGQAALDLVERVRALPGVEAAGAGNMAPMSSATAVSQFELPATVTGTEPVTARAVTFVVTPGYAEALSLRLVEGRFLSLADLDSPVRPLVVNEAFVRSYLDDGRPVVGRRFDGVVRDDDRPTEIVGLVGDVLKDGLDAEPHSAIYTLPRHGYGFPTRLELVIRTAGEPLALVPAVRTLVGEVAPAAAVEVATLSDRISASVSRPRFAAATLATFAILALTLAGTGLYGVLSYHVSKRRREMGVRGALGADRATIVKLVLKQGLMVTAAGLGLGLAGAAAAARFLASLLFGVTPYDAAAFFVAPLLLLAVALGACLLPAWRAASVPPTEALRAD